MEFFLIKKITAFKISLQRFFLKNNQFFFFFLPACAPSVYPYNREWGEKILK